MDQRPLPGAASGKPLLELAYFSQENSGGLADYAREQARALRASGVCVQFVTTPSVAGGIQNPASGMVPILAESPVPQPKGGKFARRLRTMSWILGNMRTLARWIEQEEVKQVLIGAYMEYFAPLWAPQFQRLAQRGVIFGSVVHDPVRQTRIGPRWFHRRSIGDAYSFLSEAFVHDPIDLDTVRPVKHLRTTVIPHGPYHFPPAASSRDKVRAELGIPADTLLLLAFGHIRNAKNLDLALRAMVSNPKAHLLVAGKELSATQRPASYYQELAVQLGVADRCRWRTGFVRDDEVGNFFAACDLVLLTYNAGFRSASGVLNVAVQYRKPCLASGGEGNLKTSVAKHGIGLWIEPDDVKALSQALTSWRPGLLRPDWDGYERENSWERNAILVRQRFLAHVPADTS